MVNEENSNEHIEEVAKSEQSEVAKSDNDVVEKFKKVIKKPIYKNFKFLLII